MPARFIIGTIQFITTLIEGLLGLRIILKILGASTTAPFVRWTYETTDPLLYPFREMFPSPELSGGFVIEFSALFAVLVYAFFSYATTHLMAFLIYQSNKIKS